MCPVRSCAISLAYPTAVWKAINQLKEAGYEIEAVQNKGYHLVSVPDRMDEVELASIRKTEWAGAETYYFDKIDSTNTKAKELAEEGHPSGTFVVATSRLREKDVADGHGIPFREREFI